MEFFAAERDAAFQQALADQARKQWLASIDARIKAYSEHARRSDAQKARWAIERIKDAIRADGRRFVVGLRLALHGAEQDGKVWRRVHGVWREIPFEKSLIRTMNRNEFL